MSESGARLADVLIPVRRKQAVSEGVEYPAAGVLKEGRGLLERDPFIGGVTNYATLFRIEAGDVVLRTITAFESPVGVADERHAGKFVSGVFETFQVRDTTTPAYLAQYFLFPNFWHQMQMRAQGSVLRRKTISRDLFLEIPMFLPTLEEQHRIVDLMQAAEAEVAAADKVLAAVRAVRSDLLSELLAPPESDSWQHTTLGVIAQVIGGGTPKTGVNKYWGGEVLWITPTEVVALEGKPAATTTRTITKEGLNSCGATLLPKHAVLFTSRASIGAVSLVQEPMATNQGFASFICSERILPEFLADFLRANKNALLARASGNTFREISRQNVKSFPIALPPLAEQHRIVEIMQAADAEVTAAEGALAAAKALRADLLQDLLSGTHRIPASYDAMLEAV